MSEPLVDAQELLRGLDEHKVEYVVFGALAMLFYGFVRTTEDLDIVVAPDKENLNPGEGRFLLSGGQKGASTSWDARRSRRN